MKQGATGVDIIEIARIEASLAKFGDRFLQRVYTPLEVAFCRGRASELAARFAGKEAVMKALGTGAHGVAWREIEILPNHRGKPPVYLHGRAPARAGPIALAGVRHRPSHRPRWSRRCHPRLPRPHHLAPARLLRGLAGHGAMRWTHR